MNIKLLTTFLLLTISLTSCTPAALPIVSLFRLYFDEELGDLLFDESNSTPSDVDVNSIEYLQDLEVRYAYPENYLEMLEYELSFAKENYDKHRLASVQFLQSLYYAKMQEPNVAKRLVSEIAFIYEVNSIYHELYLSHYYIYDKDMTEAKRLLDQIEEMVPNLRYLNEGYAKIYLNRESSTLYDPKKAIKYAKKALESGGYYEGHIVLAEAYLKNREGKKAAQEIEKAVQLKKIHPSDVLLQMSTNYAADGSLKSKKKINGVVLKNPRAKYMIEDYFNCTYSEFLK